MKLIDMNEANEKAATSLRILIIIFAAQLAEVGPLQRQLQRHGGAQGLAFGFYGEASRSIHELAKELAEEIAGQPDEDWICSMGENRASKVRNSIIKDWGLAATFGFAEFKLKGLFKLSYCG